MWFQDWHLITILNTLLFFRLFLSFILYKYYIKKFIKNQIITKVTSEDSNPEHHSFMAFYRLNYLLQLREPAPHSHSDYFLVGLTRIKVQNWYRYRFCWNLRFFLLKVRNRRPPCDSVFYLGILTPLLYSFFESFQRMLNLALSRPPSRYQLALAASPPSFLRNLLVLVFKKETNQTYSLANYL